VEGFTLWFKEFKAVTRLHQRNSESKVSPSRRDGSKGITF
jgi:hypothetical protein